jgi:hypothetical protein
VKILADLLGSRERQRIKKRQVFRDITAQHGIFDAARLSLPAKEETAMEGTRRPVA